MVIEQQPVCICICIRAHAVVIGQQPVIQRADLEVLGREARLENVVGRVDVHGHLVQDAHLIVTEVSHVSDRGVSCQRQRCLT